MERSHEYHPNQRYSATLPDTGTTPGNPISSVRSSGHVPDTPIQQTAVNVTLFSIAQAAFHRHDLCVLKTVDNGRTFVRFQLPLAFNRRIKNFSQWRKLDKVNNLQKYRINSRLQPDH